MEIRDFAQRVLLTPDLAAKLLPPVEPLTDQTPGVAIRHDEPSRPDDLQFAPRRTAPAMPAPGAFHVKRSRAVAHHIMANHELQALDTYSIMRLQRRSARAPSTGAIVPRCIVRDYSVTITVTVTAGRPGSPGCALLRHVDGLAQTCPVPPAGVAAKARGRGQPAAFALERAIVRKCRSFSMRFTILVSLAALSLASGPLLAAPPTAAAVAPKVTLAPQINAADFARFDQHPQPPMRSADASRAPSATSAPRIVW